LASSSSLAASAAVRISVLLNPCLVRNAIRFALGLLFAASDFINVTARDTTGDIGEENSGCKGEDDGDAKAKGVGDDIVVVVVVGSVAGG